MRNPLFLHSDIISDSAIEEVNKYYNKNKKLAKPGKSGGHTVQPQIKESTDITIQPSQFYEELPKYSSEFVKVVNNYKFKYPEIQFADTRWGLTESVLIQEYKPGQGFYRPHYERENWSFTRLLVFMTYLNDSKGTYFKYQGFETEGKKGLTLIWPADWTFTHNGIIDFNNDKRIITGWLNWIVDDTR